MVVAKYMLIMMNMVSEEWNRLYALAWSQDPCNIEWGDVAL